MSDITQQMDKLEIPIKLSFPVINVSTFELGRAESVFSEIAKKVGKHFIVMPFKKLPDPGTMKAMADEAKKASKNGLVVFDTFFFDRQRASPETLPALKSSLIYLENEGINYIIAGKDVFNEEFVYHIDLPAMRTRKSCNCSRPVKITCKKVGSSRATSVLSSQTTPWACHIPR